MFDIGERTGTHGLTLCGLLAGEEAVRVRAEVRWVEGATGPRRSRLASARGDDGRWRFCLQVTGPDRTERGRRLHEDVRRLGDEADRLIGR